MQNNETNHQHLENEQQNQTKTTENIIQENIQAHKNNQLGIAALWLGIGSFLIFATGFGWMLALVAIGIGLMQKPKTTSGKAGIILGIAHFCVMILLLVLLIVFASLFLPMLLEQFPALFEQHLLQDWFNASKDAFLQDALRQTTPFDASVDPKSPWKDILQQTDCKMLDDGSIQCP